MAQRIRSLVRVAPWIVVLLGALGPGRDEPQAHVRAWFGSVSGREVTALLPLQEGQKQRLSLELPEPSKTLDRDVRRVALVDGRGRRWAEVDPGDAGPEAPALALVWRHLHQIPALG